MGLYCGSPLCKNYLPYAANNRVTLVRSPSPFHDISVKSVYNQKDRGELPEDPFKRQPTVFRKATPHPLAPRQPVQALGSMAMGSGSEGLAQGPAVWGLGLRAVQAFRIKVSRRLFGLPLVSRKRQDVKDMEKLQNVAAV